MNRKKTGLRFAWLLLALLALCMAGCAASGRPDSQTDKFGQMDANNDGNVVVEEFLAANPGMDEKTFIIIDANNDKKIDRKEWYDYLENPDWNKEPMKSGPGAPMNNIPGDPLIPPPDSNDLPLMRPQDY